MYLNDGKYIEYEDLDKIPAKDVPDIEGLEYKDIINYNFIYDLPKPKSKERLILYEKIRKLFSDRRAKSKKKCSFNKQLKKIVIMFDILKIHLELKIEIEEYLLRNEQGFIYFIKSEQLNGVKIGMTGGSDYEKCLKRLKKRYLTTYGICEIYMFYTKNRWTEEKKIHEEFKFYKSVNEVFDKEILNFIDFKDLKSYF